MCAVHPVADEPLSGAPFCLRNLCLVMRKDVVYAAAMDVELVPQKLRRHRTALDMPTRTSSPPRTFPLNRTVFFSPCFPERKVPDVFFVVFVVSDPTGRPQF